MNDRDFRSAREAVDLFPRKPAEPEDPTPLARFMRIRKIKTGRLAQECGYSRQHVLRLSTGRVEPTRPCMLAIVAACRRLTGVRVEAGDVFALKIE